MLDTASIVDFDRDVRAVTHAASRIAADEGWTAMTPELLLLAALHDDAVAAFWGRERATEAAGRLRTAIAERERRPARRPTGLVAVLDDDPVLGGDGWSVLGHLAIAQAMRRASRRGYVRPADVPAVAADTTGPAWTGWSLRSVVRAVSRLQVRRGTWIARGDLLHGLAHVPVLADPATLDELKALPRLYGPLDREDPPAPAGDATGEAPPPGVHRAAIVLDDDDVSAEGAVVTILVDELGLSRERAAVGVHRVHFRGADAVATLPWDEAQRAIARCRARAAELAPGLVVRLVPA